MKPLNIRASSLPSYQDCARRAIIPVIRDRLEAAGYVFKATRPGVGQCIGTACHAAAASAMDNKLRGIATDAKFHTDQAIATYDAESVDGIEMDTATSNKNEAYQQIQTLTDSFQLEILPIVSPARIEAAVEAIVPQQIYDGEVTVSGHMDLCTDAAGIEDWKFGSVHRSHHSQMGMYSLLERSQARPAVDLVVSHLPRVRISKPYPGAQRYPLDIAACERAAKSVLMQMIRDVAEFERTVSPWSFGCNPGSMMCSEKYCIAKGTEWCEITK